MKGCAPPTASLIVAANMASNTETLSRTLPVRQLAHVSEFPMSLAPVLLSDDHHVQPGKEMQEVSYDMPTLSEHPNPTTKNRS